MESEQLEHIYIVVARYYLLPEATPAPHHFEDWIESLQEPAKSVYRKKGFGGCKEILNFRRFVAEMNDRGLEEYMQANLSEADYSIWQ